jgi:NTE family protein
VKGAGVKTRLVGLSVTLTLTATVLYAQPAARRVGVAFGGGSARGIAHVGVVKWFEEHHVPIDVGAGTSMGGLIGGAFASGMPADELRTLIESIDWDQMFGSSSFPFKNVRRKEDARDFPSRLEFGLRRGIVLPTSLNNGQQVDLLLSRIAGAYYDLDSFDALPTPFRTVAVDLKTAERVVLDNGSLTPAMRATMSLPGVFPPVELGERVLVDGGALDNIPADVVRDMGASFVIAIDVGNAPEENLNYSMFALMGQTIDSMMKANTRRALQAADLVIQVDVQGFGSLDWRRSAELMQRGYEAAEKHRAELLPHALNDADWQSWVNARASRRRHPLPVPKYLATAGIAPSDATMVRRILAPHVDQSLDLPNIEKDLSTLSGLDRYQTVSWELMGPSGNEGLLIHARDKVYAPPFMMLGFSLENRTSSDFRVQMAARYLSFDVLGSGSELRVDGVIGSDPSAAFSLYRPIFGRRVFVRPYAAATVNTLDFIVDDQVIAQYDLKEQYVGGDIGLAVSRESEVYGGLRFGHAEASVRAGDPGLPEASGAEDEFRLNFIHDGQDSPVVPSRGTQVLVGLTHYIQSPSVPGVERTNKGVTQLEGGASRFWSWRRRNRLFAMASGGTSFDGHPISQFPLGYPFRLDAFRIGERRGDHYAAVTFGAARQVGRLADFIGGPVFVGSWLENGSAWDTHQDPDIHSQAAVGLVLDTLIGPAIVGTSIGLDGGGFRFFFGVGRVVRLR